jgi:hypothetical protein
MVTAQFCIEIIHEWDFGSCLHIADMCGLCKIPCLARNLVLRGLQFQKVVVCYKFSGGRSVIYYRLKEYF